MVAPGSVVRPGDDDCVSWARCGALVELQVAQRAGGVQRFPRVAGVECRYRASREGIRVQGFAGLIGAAGVRASVVGEDPCAYTRGRYLCRRDPTCALGEGHRLSRRSVHAVNRGTPVIERVGSAAGRAVARRRCVVEDVGESDTVDGGAGHGRHQVTGIVVGEKLKATARIGVVAVPIFRHIHRLSENHDEVGIAGNCVPARGNRAWWGRRWRRRRWRRRCERVLTTLVAIQRAARVVPAADKREAALSSQGPGPGKRALSRALGVVGSARSPELEYGSGWMAGDGDCLEDRPAP